MAGGTGGHIYPGLAVADQLKLQGWNIAWLGTRDGMEARIIPENGYQFHCLKIFGVRGKSLISYLLLPFYISLSFVQSMRVLLKVKPNVVLSMGGYVAFPGGIVAFIFRIPLIVHEQNSIPGLTNKLLSKLASRNLVAFPDSLPGATHTGNPIRSNIEIDDEVEERLRKHHGPLRILVLGGSRGSDALNKVIPEAISLLSKDCRPNVIHQSGATQLEELIARYKKYEVDATCYDFIHDVGELYRDADLVICRAGAMTISELSVVGVASFLVPFPYAVDDHQTQNALFLADNGAAFHIPQDLLTADYLSQLLLKIDRRELISMALNARFLSVPNSASVVAGICELEATHAS